MQFQSYISTLCFFVWSYGPKCKPPSGLAIKFTNANEDAIRPEKVAVMMRLPLALVSPLNVSSKNIGSIETTASSAPKFAK